MHNFIKQTALSIGLDACGIAKAGELTNDAVFLKTWLDEGKHGTMSYLMRNIEKRINPCVLVPQCKSVVVVLLNYFPSQFQNPNAPQIAKYAFPETDYHLVLKSKLTELEERIVEVYGTDVVSPTHQHSFVDSAPILERRWAERAGLGWIGKHTQLIHHGLGSYVFIGVLLLNVETEYDSPIANRCGTCTKCMDACPTKALENGSLDARNCISYLTIEHKDKIPTEFHSSLSGCVLGCDICADVCPWNKKWATPNTHEKLNPTKEILEWDEENWLHLKENKFNEVFRHSAIRRAGYRKLLQNIALFQSGEKIGELRIKV